jgi:phospholipid/cholesterol/gamma-HCH transport system ATP-binding protein
MVERAAIARKGLKDSFWQFGCITPSTMAALGASSLDQTAQTPSLNLPDAPPLLRLDRVTVRFDDQPALSDISIRIYRGKTTVMFGAAGSGKTVLLKTAIGLIRPDAGRVYLLGQDITGLDEEQLYPLRRNVGMLFQEGGLFDSLTVEENVAFPLLERERKLQESEVRERVKEELDIVELAGNLEKYPSELSGGMRRRVGIARAAITKPPLILYDSPTAGLDPITAYRIIALVIQQRDTQNTTSLVVTHRYQDGHMLANLIHDPHSNKLVRASQGGAPTNFLVLRAGRLVFEGSEADLRSLRDPYVSKFVKRT